MTPTTHLTIALFLLVLGATVASPVSAQCKPTTLRCEYMSGPLSIESQTPRLSWQLEDKRRGAVQTAYQVQVADSQEALKSGKANAWDSGKVQSDQSVHIAYSGARLRSQAPYYWRVKVWDKDGKPSRWSPAASWEMAILDPMEWHAKWIGMQAGSSAAVEPEKVSDVKWIWYPEGDPRTSAPKGTRYFRASFDLPADKQISSASLYAAVDNSARCWVNGQEAGSANGWPNFVTMNIAGSLRTGKNVIAISAYNSDGPAGLAAIAHVRFADGGHRLITGDAVWKSANSDAPGWNTTGYNDAGWKPALTIANVGDAPWSTPGISSPSIGGSAAQLRKEFAVAKPVKSARVYVTALGSYRLHINGKRVGSDILTPDWTDYRKRINYQVYDVTRLINSGDNAMAAILGDGWYASGLGWNLQRNVFGDPPSRLLMQLRIDFADGSHEEILSDGSWKTATGPILRSEIYAGETYDARKELWGWTQPGYSDSSWQSAAVYSQPSYQPARPDPFLDFPTHPVLVAQSSPTIQVTEEIKPKKITEPKPGVYVFDMGQNMVGWCRLVVKSAPAGTSIRLRFAEILQPDGNIYTENLRRAEVTDTYTCRGSGTPPQPSPSQGEGATLLSQSAGAVPPPYEGGGKGEVEAWEPHFTYHGFRYVEVTGFPGKPTLSALTGRVFHTNTPVSGKFECSSPMVNQLAKNILWGQRGNQHSIPTDCPQRDERLGWMGDAGIFSRTACYNMDMASFYGKWMRDIVDAQSRDGGFPDVAPRVIDAADGAPAWGDCGVIVPYEVYRQYGDTSIIRENWDAMARWVEYIHKANPNLLWLKRRNNDFGDWVPANSETPKDVIATAMWAYDAQLMSRMATAVGRTDDARKYEELYQGIKKAFIEKYVKEDGTVGNGSQTCQALAIHMDLIPNGGQGKVAGKLVGDIEKRSGHLSTGFVGTCYLMRALTAGGKNDVAYRLLLNDTYPSWGYMISKGATTMWERWNGDSGDPAMNSFNHYAFGAVGEWLYRYVAGIDTETGSGSGFKKIIIHPRPGNGLTSARGEYDSVHGKIVSEWKQNPQGGLSLHVTIPANTTATIYIPASDPSKVTESGREISTFSGIKFVRMEDGNAVYKALAGSYQLDTR